MSGRDLIGVSPTGSGKTLAYLLPMFEHCKAWSSEKFNAACYCQLSLKFELQTILRAVPNLGWYTNRMLLSTFSMGRPAPSLEPHKLTWKGAAIGSQISRFGHGSNGPDFGAQR